MQPQYAPQYPQYPAQPAPQGYPAQPQYAPPAPAYGPPPVQYAPPPQYAPPMPAPVAGSLDEFFSQPGGGSGASWKFNGKPIGTAYSGIVARAVTKGDVRQQTDNNGRPLTFKDGRAKFVMVVPMLVQPSAEYPEGTASWWVKGQGRDELVRAMAEAGAPEGPPEAGAAISVTLVGSRPIPNMNPAFQYRVNYVRPAGAAADTYPAPVAQPQPAPHAYGPQPTQPGYAPNQPADVYPAPVAQPAPFVPQLQYAPQPAPAAQPAPAPQAQPAYVPGIDGSMVSALNIGATVTPSVPSQTPPPVLATGLNETQQALMAQLTAQPQPTH